jgi:hypothetical protein
MPPATRTAWVISAKARVATMESSALGRIEDLFGGFGECE